jgi:hypothetical protein
MSASPLQSLSTPSKQLSKLSSACALETHTQTTALLAPPLVVVVVVATEVLLTPTLSQSGWEGVGVVGRRVRQKPLWMGRGEADPGTCRGGHIVFLGFF